MTKDDEVAELFIANSHDVIMCFSTAGRVYPIDVFELPEGKALKAESGVFLIVPRFVAITM